MTSAAEPVPADDFAELLEAVRAGAIAAGHFFLMDMDEEEAAFNDALLDALTLPPSVLVVHLRVSDLEPGDRDYVRTMPWTLGRHPLGGVTSVPDIERAKKRGFTETEIDAAVKRATASQEPRPAAKAPMPERIASDAPAQPAQEADPFPRVIDIGQAKRRPTMPGIRFDTLKWNG